MKRIMILMSALILLVGCASLPVIMSNDINDEQTAAKYYFDVDSNIAYKIEHDDEYLYLHLKTDDQTAIKKIMMQGLFIYFDEKGGKSKKVYYNYPTKPARGQGQMSPDMMKQQIGGQQESFKREFDVNRFFDLLSMEAIYSKNDMAEKIPVFSSATEFQVELTAPNQNILEYALRIPLNEVCDNDVDELSIGIMTGEFEMPSRSGGGGGQGGPGGGGQGGGMGGGRSGGGPGGSQGGGMQGSGMDREAMTEQLSVWFKVSLKGEAE